MINGEPRHIIGYLADFLFPAERARVAGQVAVGRRAEPADARRGCLRVRPTCW